MAALFCPRIIQIRPLVFTTRASTIPALVKASFHTSTTNVHQSSNVSQSSPTIPKSSILRRVTAIRVQPTAISARHASSSSTTAASSTSVPDDVLTWDRFFDLRRKRRWFNLGSSVVTAATSVGVFAPMLAQYDFDSWGAQLSGIDPIFVLGISTFAIAAGGWLCGPAFGNTMFSLWAGRKGWAKLIAEKEKSFYARIKRYRADASASSPQNPLPDYYGEKIASVKDYRRWLKDQRAFNLKKDKNMI